MVDLSVGLHTIDILLGTYSVCHKDPAILSDMLSSQYQAISNYVVTNKLVIKDDKINLMVLGTMANR